MSLLDDLIKILKQLFNLPPLDPLTSFRFLVEIDGKPVGAFSQFSGISMQTQTIQARSGNDIRGVQEYIPVLTTFKPVTLSKGVIGDSQLLKWMFDAAASDSAGPKKANLRRTISVIALDEKGQEAVIWTLKNAMPIAYELSPMSSTSSEVLTENVTFAIQGVDRTLTTLRKLLQLFSKSV